MSTELHIVVVEKDPERARMIEEGLRLADVAQVTIIDQDRGLARRIAECAPDMVLIALQNPSRDYMEELTLATGPLDRPVAMFVDRSDSAMTSSAISAGVSAYVVDGLARDRIKPILEAAIARFGMVQKMRVELEATRRALEDRKVIDRAKGLLMRARNIDEEAAYGLLRKTAMAQGKKMADVAQALVTASELLK